MPLKNKNKTPLHYAAEKNSKEIGEILISKGVDPNIKDSNTLLNDDIFKLRKVI